jgi:hypothetical protein
MTIATYSQVKQGLISYEEKYLGAYSSAKQVFLFGNEDHTLSMQKITSNSAIFTTNYKSEIKAKKIYKGGPLYIYKIYDVRKFDCVSQEYIILFTRKFYKSYIDGSRGTEDWKNPEVKLKYVMHGGLDAYYLKKFCGVKELPKRY